MFVPGEVTAAVHQDWYSFDAVKGQTYQLETEMCTDRGCLEDTVMELIDRDQSTLLIENDDDERVTDRLDSFIEWTCPASGTYFVMVSAYLAQSTGTFQVKVTQASAADSDDPCDGGTTFSGMPAATVEFSSSNEAHMLCDWVVQCEASQAVSVHFIRFSTEVGMDTVNLYNGPTDSDHKIRGSNLSGELADLPTADFVSTSSAVLIAFTSDESEGDTGNHGFELSYLCVDGTAVPPAPPSAGPPPPPAPGPPQTPGALAGTGLGDDLDQLHHTADEINALNDNVNAAEDGLNSLSAVRTQQSAFCLC